MIVLYRVWSTYLKAARNIIFTSGHRLLKCSGAKFLT